MSTTTTGPLIFGIATGAMAVVIVLAYAKFLICVERTESGYRALWGVFYGSCRQFACIVFAVLMAVAYAAFVILFVIDADQADTNSMYVPVCTLSMVLCVSLAVWPYLVRRVEADGEILAGDMCCECLESCLQCFCGILVKAEVFHVHGNMFFSAILSICMLVLFCFGAAGSEDGFTSHAVYVACLIGYMAFHLTFMDGLLWGYYWKGKAVLSEGTQGVSGAGSSSPRVGTGSHAPFVVPPSLWPAITADDCTPLLVRVGERGV
jgi:hypothetical protein